MGATKKKAGKRGGKGKIATAQKSVKKTNKDEDPIVTKNGFALKQSVWTSVRASINKFGVTNQPKYFDLFMELPEMHSRIHNIPLCEAVLNYDDNCAKAWFDSEAGMRWELPKYNLKLDQHGNFCKKYKITKSIYEAEWNDQHLQGHAPGIEPEKQPMYHTYETLRRNYWNRAGRYFRDYWLLNPHLSRKEAFDAAYKFGKKWLTSLKSYDQVKKTTLKQAQANWMIQTVAKLEDHLVDNDGVLNFEDEADSIALR